MKKEEKDIDEDIRMKVTKKENILLVGFLGIIYGSLALLEHATSFAVVE